MPPLVPRLRAVRHAFKAVKDPTPFLTANVREYGKSYTFHLGGLRKGIVTTEPAFMQYILQKNHRNYRKSKMQTEILAHYAGQGLLTAEGPFWLRQRRLIQPAFHRDKLNRLVGLIHDEIDRFLSNEWINGGERLIFHDMHRLAFHIVARALFSTALTDTEITILSKKISAIQAFIVQRIRQPYLHYWFHVNGSRRKYDRINREVRDILSQVVTIRKQSGQEFSDLLDLLLQTRYEDTGEPMRDNQILDEALIMFTAGHETSANALSWTLHLLAQNPQYIAGIRTEYGDDHDLSLRSVFGRSRTRQVIEESMRIYPPAWVIDRLSNKADKYGAFNYPADTFFVLWIYGMHRDPGLWPDPLRFDPTRFEEKLGKSRIPFSYVPFGAGPRQCIGNQFAMMEMILVLGYIQANYTLEFSESEVGIKPLITLRPDSALPARVRAR